jgi:CHASE2 domain-containing sensor protein
MAIVRWTNLICGGLLSVAALGFLLLLPGSIADIAQEPEDVWLGGFWIALLGLLTALCFANAWRSNEPPQVGWRMVANFVTVIALAALLVLGANDPAVPPLLVLCALGPVAALLGAWRQSRVQQP